MKPNFYKTFLAGLLCQFGFAQDFNATKLNEYFSALETHDKFMGSVAVSQNGKLIYAKAIGFADVEHNLKADEFTKYRIGSITKTFTSVLILKAVEEHKITLDQTIASFFPNVKNAEKITIKQLLNHKSGIPNFTDDAEYMSYHTQPKTEKEMVALIAKAGSDFEPNSKSQYSNSNYVLLTYILEKTYKNSYADLVQKYIAKPLGLENTYFGHQINTAKKEAKSYRFIGTWQVEDETNTSIPLGAGGIVSTPTDLVKFSDALFQGKILKKESLELMKTIEGAYGLGLFTIPFDNKIGFAHTGGIDGFTSIFSYFDDGKISYALTSNGTNYNNNDISLTVLSAVYNKSYEIPMFSTYKVTSADLDPYVGIYTSKQIPLKIEITKDNATLIAQATGQSSFPLEATEKDQFKFDMAGVVLEFNPANKTMILKQGSGQFIFTKE
ncbi:MAG TPA: serine hydrolase domain-containing protein [Flavobacterium sp.]|nr:serine hydrolase domain-containing protein [Flavobacterium sp.]